MEDNKKKNSEQNTNKKSDRTEFTDEINMDHKNSKSSK